MKPRQLIAEIFGLIILVIFVGRQITASAQDNLFFSIFLPLVIKEEPPPTPTPTPTPTPPPGQLKIMYIFYDGAGRQEPDEYVEIKNIGTGPVQLGGWTLSDIANHTFIFPTFTMEPNQVCRVYTNQVHLQWCGFSYGSGSAIWNNTGDCAYLRDPANNLVDQYCYP